MHVGGGIFIGNIMRISAEIVEKWFEKGNMAARMRDILPRSGLGLEEREEVAALVHRVVRWRKWYSFIIEHYSLPEGAETYVRLANSGDIWESAEKAVPDGKRTEIRHSFSPYLAHLVDSRFPELREYLNREPKTVLCVNFNRSNREDVAEILRDEGMDARSSVLESALITDSRARYSRAVREGFAQVQDESSQLVAKITASLGGDILDYCAGNGVKSIAMASFGRNRAKIRAWDIDEQRRKVARRRAELFGAKIEVLDERPHRRYGTVLVDAPCTGVGSARRNPEAKYVENAGDYPEKQLSILEETAGLVEKGGYLVYCVCSFTPEETVAVAGGFIEEHGEFEESRPDENGLRRMSTGYLTEMPDGDVMYLCVMRRKS